MIRKISFQLVTLLTGLLLYGCSGGVTATTATPSAAPKDDPVPQPARPALNGIETIRLDPKMLSSIRIEELKEELMPSVLTASGKVTFNEDRMAQVIAPVVGQVRDLKVKVGDRIEKGDILFNIYSREVAAAISEHLESHKDLDLADKTYTMTKDLFEHQAASRIALEQSESDLAKAKARVNRTEEALRVLGVGSDDELHATLAARVPVRAQISGTVIDRRITEGQFVQSDATPLLSIADLSTVWVLADVFERDIHLVQVGEKVEVVAAAYPDEHFTARVARLSDVVDPSTRAVKVRFLVSNARQRLKPEMFASATIFLNEATRALSVPAKAIFTEGGRNYVYVVAGDGQFRREPVEVIHSGGDRLRVISGVSAGDKVVSDGALLIRVEERRMET